MKLMHWRQTEVGGEEAEKTLTELLVRPNANDGILFIAATNRKDMLDDLLRPGKLTFFPSTIAIRKAEENY